MEETDDVYTVEEFGFEMTFERRSQHFVGIFVDSGGVGVSESQRLAVGFEFRDAHVTGHDNDGVLKVHRPALTVGKTSVVEYLQHDIINVGMSFFDFVEQYHRIGFAAHLFGELSAVVESHVSRRSADEFGHRMSLHVLRHIETYNGVLVVEHGFAQRLRQLSLAYARGAEEQERTDRSRRIFKAGTRTPYRLGYAAHRFVLAYDALVQNGFEVHQSLGFRLVELAYGDFGPLGHYFGYVVGAYGTHLLLVGFCPIDLVVGHTRGKFVAFAFQLGGLFEVLRLDGGGKHALYVFEIFLLLFKAVRHGGARNLYARHRLVDKVDGFVGQESVGNISVRKFCGGNDGVVGYFDLVERLVIVFEAL